MEQPLLVYYASMVRQSQKKITVYVPAETLKRATAEGEGVTDVIREALELRANQQAWRRLEKWAGKVSWSVDLEELRED